MHKPQTTRFWTRWQKAFYYSYNGVKHAWKGEAAFRQEIIAFIVMTPLAYWIGHNGTERALMIGSMILIMIVELLNSAVEAVVDRFGGEWHELSGRAKDLGSAAVLVAIINAGIIWLMIVWDRFLV